MAKKQNNSYQASMDALEALLLKVEEEEVSIDELSQLVKDSVKLLKNCKEQLKGIERDVESSLDDLSGD